MAQDVKKDFDWGILGCGWLGTAWGLQCTSRGDRVWGSARRPEALSSLEQVGIHPVFFNSDRDESDALPDCKTLLIALPPSAGVDAFQRASKLAEACEWTVLISSTSVYPGDDGEYRESDATRRISPHSGMCLLDLERLFNPETTSILRAGGLFGPGRHPGQFLRGRPLARPTDPVNMIHLTDVLRAIEHVSRMRLTGACNLVAPVLTSREAFYASAGAVTVNPPNPARAGGRRVLPDRIVASGFSFQHPDPARVVAGMTRPAE